EAIQTALGNAQTAAEGLSFDDLTLPSREPITLVAPVSATLRELLGKLFEEYNAYVAQHNEEIKQPVASRPYVIHGRNALSPLASSDLNRTCQLLENGGSVFGTFGTTLAFYHQLFSANKGVFRTILEHPDLKLIHLVRLLAMLKRLQRPAERQSGMD